jgi:hypothetical protein
LPVRCQDLFGELDHVALTSSEAIPVVRALRAAVAAGGLRARVESGAKAWRRHHDVNGQALFWKDKA